MKKFSNASSKINIILSVFKDGEKLTGRDISKRIRELGYDVDEGELKMFIYYHMQYQYLMKEKVNGVNKYYAI